MQPIAIIGMSCLFPGAKNTKEFWENLIQGINSCTSATSSNLEADVAKYFSEKTLPKKTSLNQNRIQLCRLAGGSTACSVSGTFQRLVGCTAAPPRDRRAGRHGGLLDGPHG